MIVETHLLQNFAPSCLNRDDTNSPKDCEFGGFRRARISSQCIKRAIRHHPVFAETLGRGIGVRTKLLAEAVAVRLAQGGREPDGARAIALAVVEALMGKMKADKTSVLIYLGDDETGRIADAIEEHWDAVAPHVPAAGEDDGKQRHYRQDVPERHGRRRHRPLRTHGGREHPHERRRRVPGGARHLHPQSLHGDGLLHRRR